jgi:hypothetical protein
MKKPEGRREGDKPKNCKEVSGMASVVRSRIKENKIRTEKL